MQKSSDHETKIVEAPGETKERPVPETKDDDDEDARTGDDRNLVGVTFDPTTALYVVPILVSEEFYNELTSEAGLTVSPVTNVKLRRDRGGHGNAIEWA